MLLEAPGHQGSNKRNMNRNLVKILNCYKAQCASNSPKPCWIRRSAPLPYGINLHGRFLYETGLGETARLLHNALSTQGIDVAIKNIDLKNRPYENDLEHLMSKSLPYNFSMTICGLTALRGIRHQICAQKHNIVFFLWELDKIPSKFVSYLKKFDTIWVPSNFIFQTLREHGFDNVELVKHPIALPSLTPEFFNVTGTLKILFYFDYDSYPKRKNPEAAVHAFKQAFPNGEDVSLTIKTRGTNDQGRRSWLAKQTSNDPRINVIDTLLSRNEISALIESHHVFLSLHRSEGLGLGCAEALAAGNAVIATDYGGSAEFIGTSTGFPVTWSPVQVGSEDYVLSGDSTWAEPSIDHATELLRSIYENPTDAKERVKNGYNHLLENHSFSATGLDMVNKLERLRNKNMK